MQNISFREIIAHIENTVTQLQSYYKGSSLADFLNFFYSSIHSVLHLVWHFFGLYLPTHATLLTIVFSSIGIYVTIKKNRKIAKEKNSLEFDNYCQTNPECASHYKKVRSICTDITDDDGNINKELQDKKIGVYCSLPEKLKEERKNLEEHGYTKKMIRKFINKKYAEELEYFSSIGFILNMWERCATAIRNDIYDEDIIYDIQCRAAVIIYDSFRPYIKSAQKRNNQRVFMNFEWLIKKWKLERCKTGEYTEKENEAFRAFEKAKKICDYVALKKSQNKKPNYIYKKICIFLAEKNLNKYKKK